MAAQTRRGPSSGDATQPVEFAPEWARPPGEILQAELKARGITQAELSLRASLSAKHVNQVIKGIVNLSPDVAIALERTLDIRADFWLKTEAMWRAIETRADSKANLAQFTDWFARFPLAILMARGIVKQSDDTETRIDLLLRLFRVTDATAFDKVWLQPQANFKRSQQYDVDPYSTALWIRLAELDAEARTDDVNDFDPRRVRLLLPSLPKLTRQEMPEAFVAARDLLAEAGVILVFVPEIANTRICGISRWLPSGHPIIALTNRNKRLDSFWFYLAHELGHVLLHPGRATYVDLFDKSVHDDKDEKESAANEFAERLFLSAQSMDRLADMAPTEIETFAAELGIATEIVAGQHAHMTNSWRAVSKLRKSVNLDAMLANV
jgi:HTH-type transcriptional regulator/antitoxin HigA